MNSKCEESQPGVGGCVVIARVYFSKYSLKLSHNALNVEINMKYTLYIPCK